MSFIRINNRNNFLIKEVKSYHPESNDYVAYWRKHKQRCIEGLWSLDSTAADIEVEDRDFSAHVKKHKEGWRWMTPNLYFYVNFGTILHNPPDAPKTAPKKRMRPFLRDIEWEFFYNWAEARGFSGFEDDDEFTCHRSVIEAETDDSVTIDKSAYNSKGEVKTYITAREYLRKTHSKPYGQALWENQATNLFMLGARGFGKSFMVGVGIILYEILFDGARYYTQESINNPAKNELLVGAALSSKSSDLLAKVKEAIDNIPGSWGDSSEFTPSPFYKEMTGSLKPNNGKNLWQHWYDKKVGGQWIKEGTKSNLKHVTFTTENPEAGAGGRHAVIVVEEVGLCPNILTIHGSNTACMMEGENQFGSCVYLGTGGNMEKIVESQVMFYDPEGFDFLAFDNPWENDQRKTGWFVPAIYGLNQFKDENGNTDIEGALAYKEKIREKKMRSKDTSAIDLEMLNYPLVPSEMFLSKVGNIFPIALLKEREAEVDGNEKYANAEYIGKLVGNPDTDQVEWKLDPTARPIKHFPLKEEDRKRGVEGAVVIYQHPYEDEYGDVMYGRYIAGCDPYDHDDAGTGSLGSTIVYDKLSKQVVAEYTGRPETANKYYEEVRKLLKYYNARLLYENERKGIYDYFEKKKCVYMLQEQPEIIKDVLQTTRVNRNYGMHMNKSLKRYGEELIKTWLLEPYNDEEGSEKLNLHEIRCLPLIKELAAYNTDGNFDRVMAFMMVMYFIQETRKIEVREKSKAKNTYIGNSDFFNKGLRKKKKFF